MGSNPGEGKLFSSPHPSRPALSPPSHLNYWYRGFIPAAKRPRLEMIWTLSTLPLCVPLWHVNGWPGRLKMMCNKSHRYCPVNVMYGLKKTEVSLYRTDILIRQSQPLLRSTPMKMELPVASETSAIKTQTPGDWPKDTIRNPNPFWPFKDEAQSALVKDPVRTAQ